MIKKTLALAAAASSLLALVGCSSTYLSQPSSPLNVETTARVTPIIETGDQIEGVATVDRIFFFFISGPSNFAEGVNYGGPYTSTPVSDSFWGDTITEAKSAAAYTACTQNRADVILCPRYLIESTDYFFFTRTKAKVFGYKGVLKGVEIAKPETIIVEGIPTKLTVDGTINAKQDGPIKVEAYIPEIKLVEPPPAQPSQPAQNQ